MVSTILCLKLRRKFYFHFKDGILRCLKWVNAPRMLQALFTNCIPKRRRVLCLVWSFRLNPVFLFHYISKTIHLILTNDSSNNSCSHRVIEAIIFIFNMYTFLKNLLDIIKKCDDWRITSLHFEYVPIPWSDFKKMNIRTDFTCDSLVTCTRKSINIWSSYLLISFLSSLKVGRLIGMVDSRRLYFKHKTEGAKGGFLFFFFINDLMVLRGERPLTILFKGRAGGGWRVVSIYYFFIYSSSDSYR